MQGKLDFIAKPEDVTDDLILKRCKNLDDAVKLCRDCSPLNDKEILDKLKDRTGYEMQKSHFSEALNGGTRNFPPRFIQFLEDICGNWIPTRFMALSRNQELKPKKEAWELENEKLKAQVQRMKDEQEAITRFFNKAGINSVRG